MHDFCFTPLYSFTVLLGGLMAWGAYNSVPSLVAAMGCTIVTAGCSYVSLQYWINNHKKCVPAVVIELASAAAVAYKMFPKFMLATKDWEHYWLQGALFVISGIMILYYLWNLAVYRPKPSEPVKPASLDQLKKDARAYKLSKQT